MTRWFSVKKAWLCLAFNVGKLRFASNANRQYNAAMYKMN